MGSAVERLLGLIESRESFDMPQAQLLPLQIEAANERFRDRIEKIGLLAHRAEAAGVHEIAAPADLVPLLFSHTAYKSYAESWLADGKWDRMAKWLGSISAYPTDPDLDGVADLDGWVDRLETVGHFVTCSSGTTGKPAILTCSREDLDRSGRMSVNALAWALNIEPAGDFRMMSMGGTSKSARGTAVLGALANSFGSPETVYRAPGPPITVGQVAEMIALRRKVADGTASPGELASYEAISAGRQTALESARTQAIDALIERRGGKILLGGMWGTLYPVAEAVRARGYSAKDFNPGNILMVAGGLKRAALPENYREFVFETFNLSQDRVFHVYSMQEINSQFPMCPAGRYHLPAWTMLLLLDESGEELLDTRGEQEVEGRAAFFDLSMDARWGGVISGDKIKASFGRCDCGRQGPTVGPEIVRYADLVAGDKIACSGTIDAYVRGVA